MSKMGKFKIQFKTVSYVILSPRDSYAFYEDMNLTGEKKSSIIYPFYQYGEYDSYTPDTANYYIPGSSIKGAIYCDSINKSKAKLMVDDVTVPNNSICLKQIYKFQHIKEDDSSTDNACTGQDDKQQGKQARLEPFFENVAVEMLTHDFSSEFELYYDGKEVSDCKSAVRSIIYNVVFITRKKIDAMKNYMCSVREKKPEISGEIDKIINAINISTRNKNIILLGGYKGLIHSIVDIQKYEGALFVDKDLSLPYGLVEIGEIKGG